MTIGTRFGATCTLLISLTTALAGVSLYCAGTAKSGIRILATDAMPGIVYSGRILADALELRVGYWRHIALLDREAKAQIERNAEDLKQKINEDLASYERQITQAEDREEFKKIKPQLDRYIQAWDELQPLSREGKTAEAVTLALRTLTPAFNELQTLLKARTAWHKQYGERSATAAMESASRAQFLTWMLALISIGAGAGLAFVIVRKTSRELRRIIAQLSDGAQQVAGAAGQVSTSCQSLAQGSSEQAAALEQSSASTQEVQSMARNNASSALNAAQLVAETRQTIQRTNESLSQTVIAMGEISASSDKISKIVKIIDEIAFQTNILALNAAVESARAGEAGMGFAVVADEVRNLAQRCATAARETAVLVEESGVKSHQGKDRVDNVASAMQTITHSTERIKILVDSVSAGSEEQSTGIAQITQAMSQMNQVTQMTAAEAEEGAAAAEELNAQSGSLKRVVEQLTAMAGAH